MDIGAIELKLGGPNKSGPSKLALCKHNDAFSIFLNPLLLLQYNLGPSDVKSGTFWSPSLVALMDREKGANFFPLKCSTFFVFSIISYDL